MDNGPDMGFEGLEGLEDSVLCCDVAGSFGKSESEEACRRDGSRRRGLGNSTLRGGRNSGMAFIVCDDE